MASSDENEKEVTSEVLDFPEHLRTLFQRMRSDESLHDVVFMVQNERFSANRCVVAAASPVLRKMLTNGMKETTEREIQLEEVNADGWRMVLDYMYTARLEFDNIDSALRCLECANRFQCEDLEQVVSNYVGNKLDLENWYRILVVVDRINLTSLRDLTLNLVFANFYKLCFSVEISMLPLELIQEILNSDTLVVRSELDVFKAALRWGVCTGVDDIEAEANTQIATRASELLVQYKLLPNDYILLEPGSCNTRSCPVLLECVNISRVSNNDLCRVVRFCQQLCSVAQANHGVALVHLRQFTMKALNKILDFRNPIPSIPTFPRDRLPHGRNDEIFAFSYTFSYEETLISRSSCGFGDESPEFIDNTRKVKWKFKVYFRGYMQEVYDKYVSMFLYRNPTKGSGTNGDENTEFGRQFFAEIEDDSTSETLVFFQNSSNENIRDYSRGCGYGSSTFMPMSPLVDKHKIVIGVAIYTKPK